MANAARVRYLLAMSLFTPAALAACRGSATRDVNTPDGKTIEPDATPQTSTTITPIDAAAGVRVGVDDSQLDAGTASPIEEGPLTLGTKKPDASYWTVDEPPPKGPGGKVTPVRPELPRATCPSGAFCVTASTAKPAEASARRGKADAGAFAPPPHDKCPTELARTNAPRYHTFRADITKAERAKTPDACCYSWFEPCPGGRALREGSSATLVARPVARDDWSVVLPSERALDAETRSRIANHWLREAATEHASVASFNRFSLQLLALGAPRDLVLAAQEAALDEVRHAEACYSLAARFEGVRRGPAPLTLPSRAISADPVTVVLETLADGCVGESLAAYVARRVAETTVDEATGAILRTIADDEERHAELAWRTVAWLARNFDVSNAIARFTADLERSHLAHEDGSSGAPPTATSRFGVPSDATRVGFQREALGEIVLPCLRALNEECAALNRAAG